MVEKASGTGALIFRRAAAADLPAIVRLLAEDQLGRTRDDPSEPLDPSYRAAFERIAGNPRETLLVVETEGLVVGTLQLTVLDGLSRRGRSRAQIEAVRVDGRLRGRGIGEALMRHAISLARDAGCRLVQLTTDKRRVDAHRFYERLGFVASHEGMKLEL
jgi:ribosomal protein S18 acetylase RimI-like enzyme